MDLIAKITDKEIGEIEITYNNPQIRIASRGIVQNNKGEIAIFYKKNKNEYKLPGGGIEKDESKEDGFKREVLEETGCDVEIIKYMGYTEEIKSKLNFIQTSYVFISKVINDTQKLNLTQKEIDEGGELIWVTPNVALELISECFDKLKASKYDNIYSTKFIVKRDETILKEYILKYIDNK